MELSVIERLALLQVPTPDRGRFVALRLWREFREALSFDDEEIERLSFRQEEGRIHWDNRVQDVKEIEIGPTVQGMLLEQVEALDEAGQLPMAMFEICQKLGYTGAEADEVEE